MCLGIMNFRAPSVALKQENYQNFSNMQPIITLFSGAISVLETLPFDNRFKMIKWVLSLL